MINKYTTHKLTAFAVFANISSFSAGRIRMRSHTQASAYNLTGLFYMSRAQSFDRDAERDKVSNPIAARRAFYLSLLGYQQALYSFGLAVQQIEVIPENERSTLHWLNLSSYYEHGAYAALKGITPKAGLFDITLFDVDLILREDPDFPILMGRLKSIPFVLPSGSRAMEGELEVNPFVDFLMARDAHSSFELYQPCFLLAADLLQKAIDAVSKYEEMENGQLSDAIFYQKMLYFSNRAHLLSQRRIDDEKNHVDERTNNSMSHLTAASFSMRAIKYGGMDWIRLFKHIDQSAKECAGLPFENSKKSILLFLYNMANQSEQDFPVMYKTRENMVYLSKMYEEISDGLYYCLAFELAEKTLIKAMKMRLLQSVNVSDVDLQVLSAKLNRIYQALHKSNETANISLVDDWIEYQKLSQRLVSALAAQVTQFQREINMLKGAIHSLQAERDTLTAQTNPSQQAVSMSAAVLTAADEKSDEETVVNSAKRVKRSSSPHFFPPSGNDESHASPLWVLASSAVSVSGRTAVDAQNSGTVNANSQPQGQKPGRSA